MKYILSIPLLYQNNRIGVWSFICKEDNVGDQEVAIIQKLANQIARSIYYAQKYQKFETKYNALKNG